ncbi:MAG: serine/threonine-protein kinase, partial [Planctomycetota bacterium]
MQADADKPNRRRTLRVESVIRDVEAKRAAGERCSDSTVIAAHPDLMPELGRRLRHGSIVSRAIEEGARRGATRDAGIDEATEPSIKCPRCREALCVDPSCHSGEVACQSCGCRFVVAAGDDSVSERPATIGGFELLVCIGMGAFGEVWCARDPRLDRLVAIKVPRKRRISRQEREMFLREARSAAQLRHPNIVSIYDVGCDGDTVYTVSELILGDTLSERIAINRPTVRESAEICFKIGVALHEAHRAGVIHRDLKPSNI